MNHTTNSPSFSNPKEEILFLQKRIKELESAQAESGIANQLTKIVAEHSHDLVFWKDKDLNLLGYNSALQRFLERADEVSVVAVFGKIPFFIENVKKVLQSGKVLYDNANNISINQKQVDLQYAIHPFSAGDGQIAGFICIATELSSQTFSGENGIADEHEETTKLKDLILANEQLKKVNTDLDNFIYTASHDLRSPIANLEGLVTLLSKSLENKLNDEEKLMFNMMHKAVSRFKSTIHDLTQLISIDKNYKEGSEELEFNDLVEHVQTDIGQLITESGAVISMDIQVPRFKFTRKNLRSIVYNLVINAIKYRSPERPLHIHIQTRQHEDFVVLSIQDNGLGIRADQKDKLFAMFHRVHTHVEGTGIGLYVVKRIIDNNKGRIEVESEVGKGTTFHVYLNSEGDRPPLEARNVSSMARDRNQPL